MAKTPEHFIQQLRDELLQLAFVIAQPATAKWSLALALAIRIEAFEPNSGRLFIPHYWAVYVERGRPIRSPGGTMRPRRTTYFVWWRDPRKDPRFSGSTTPERASEVRRLTKQEWKFYMRQRRAQLLAGLQPDMIIAKSIKGSPPRKFFSNDGGMASLLSRAQAVGRRLQSEFIRDYLGGLLHMEVTTKVTL